MAKKPLPKIKPTAAQKMPKGFVKNPLLTLEPTRDCPCRSGQSFKDCCFLTLPKALPIHVAEEFKQTMKKPELYFITYANKHLFEPIQEGT